MPTETKDKIEFFPKRPSQVPTAPDPPDPSLDKALKDSFPASDPPSSVQPRRDHEVRAAKDSAKKRERDPRVPQSPANDDHS